MGAPLLGSLSLGLVWASLSTFTKLQPKEKNKCVDSTSRVSCQPQLARSILQPGWHSSEGFSKHCFLGPGHWILILKGQSQVDFTICNSRRENGSMLFSAPIYPREAVKNVLFHLFQSTHQASLHLSPKYYLRCSAVRRSTYYICLL